MGHFGWAGFDYFARLMNGKTTVLQATAGLPEVDPRALFQDSRGWLWIGLRFKGVSVTKDPSAETLRFVNYSTQTGLASDTVWARLEDQSHKRMTLALIYARLGQAVKAREHARRALILSPDHPSILFFIGKMEALLGNRKAALSYLRQAIERDWLQLQYFDYYARPDHGFHTMRNDPEFCALRNEVALKVEGLRKAF